MRAWYVGRRAGHPRGEASRATRRSSKLQTAQMPGSVQRKARSPPGSVATRPPSWVRTWMRSSAGLSWSQCLREMPSMFWRRSVASSSGRRPQAPTTGSLANSSLVALGHRAWSLFCRIASPIQGWARMGLPRYPPITAGRVPSAPSPQSMPNSFPYALSRIVAPKSSSESSSGFQPREAPNARPARPSGSLSTETRSGRSTNSTNRRHASGDAFRMSDISSTPLLSSSPA
mmetsp:Transcript_11466/g.36426  ORF Transcript_11466/g.36426 Transcript_11466/m.36426 type:complete len:231 (-) Transcript_11466:217-909(-)